MMSNRTEPCQDNETTITEDTVATKLSNGTTHYLTGDTKLTNGTTHCPVDDKKLFIGTTHQLANDTQLSNGTTRHLAEDAKLSYGTYHLPADDTKVTYGESSPGAADPKVPTLAEIRMAGVRTSSDGTGRRLAGATSRRLRIESLRSLSTTDDMSQPDSQDTDGGHVSKKERKKILEEMETKSKLTDYLVSRLGHRVETLDLYVNVNLDDELFLARKEMVPWRFRRSERLDKKWKSLNHVITAQEFVLAVQQAREDRLKEKTVGTSTESVDTPGQIVATTGETVTTSGQTVTNSGPTVGRSGQTVGQSGQTIGRSGHTVGRSSRAIRRSGQTVGSSSQTFGTSGVTAGPWSQTVATSGQTVDNPRPTVNTTAEIIAVGRSGETVGPSNQTVDTPGQTVATSGQIVGPSNQTVDTPGQTVATSGQIVGPSSQTVDTPGQTVATSGQIVGKSGLSAKTHVRISAQELRNYLLKDVYKSDKEDKTIFPVDQNSGEHAQDPGLRTTTDLQSDPSTTLGNSVMPKNSQYPIVGRGTHYSNRKRILKNTRLVSTEDGVVADTESNNGTLVKHVDLGTNSESQTPIGNLSNASIENSESQKVSSNPKPSGPYILNNEMKETRKQSTNSPIFKRSHTPNRHSKLSALELHFLNSPLGLISVRPISELKKPAKFTRNAQNRAQDGGHPVYATGSHFIPKTCQYCGSYSCKGYQRRSKIVHRESRTAHGDKDCGHQRSVHSHAFMSRVDDIVGIYGQRQAVSHAVHLRVTQRLQRVGVPQTSRTARGVTR